MSILRDAQLIAFANKQKWAELPDDVKEKFIEVAKKFNAAG